MADGALIALRRLAHAERLRDALATFGNERAVCARMNVGFLPDEHLIIAPAATVAAGRCAALPAEEMIPRAGDSEADEESEQETHARCI